MPFTFKLSQRLARIRCVVLLLATAALAGCEKPTGITDVAGTLSRLVVSPKVLTLRPNQTADFMAVGLTNTGDTATVAVRWSATSGAITDTTTLGGRHYGHYKASADTGTAKVIARGTEAGIADTAVVRVAPIPVMTVTVATASSTGLVTGVTVGSATITATSEGKSGSATVTVTAVAVPVASVAVSPPTPSLSVGGTVQLTAAPQDSAGNALTGRTVTWASSDATVASVSTTGLVRGVAVGSATITATSEGKSGTAKVTVTTPAPPPPPPPPPPTTGSCLVQSGSLITLSGMQTSTYQNSSASDGTKFDA